MANPIIVVDIDGTVADASWRAEKYLSTTPKDWDAFYANCSKDSPIMPIVRIVNGLAKSYKIVFCTGRRESCRKDTISWIKTRMDINQDIVAIFREDGCKEHDVYVKPRILQKYLQDNPTEKVLAILEDRNSMAAQWRRLGYICLQVADGNF